MKQRGESIAGKRGGMKFPDAGRAAAAATDYDSDASNPDEPKRLQDMSRVRLLRYIDRIEIQLANWNRRGGKVLEAKKKKLNNAKAVLKAKDQAIKEGPLAKIKKKVQQQTGQKGRAKRQGVREQRKDYDDIVFASTGERDGWLKEQNRLRAQFGMPLLDRDDLKVVRAPGDAEELTPEEEEDRYQQQQAAGGAGPSGTTPPEDDEDEFGPAGEEQAIPTTTVAVVLSTPVGVANPHMAWEEQRDSDDDSDDEEEDEEEDAAEPAFVQGDQEIYVENGEEVNPDAALILQNAGAYIAEE